MTMECIDDELEKLNLEIYASVSFGRQFARAAVIMVHFKCYLHSAGSHR